MALDAGRQLVLRWPEPDPAHVGLLKQAGIETVVVDPGAAAFEQAARAAGLETAPEAALTGTITRGLWPGIRRAPNQRDRGDETASASREPWVDANGYLIALQRTLNPGAPAVLAYRPDAKAGLPADRSVPFDTLDLALIEARVGGGNFILSVEPRYRRALLKSDPAALAAWKGLGRTAAWLRRHAAWFGRAALPTITALVEPGFTSSEIANLLYRRGASPALAAASNVPAPAPERTLALVAAGLKAVPTEVFRHASAGSIVVIDSAPDASWQVVKKDPDRTIYRVGSGEVVAYHKRIADPSEFALDVIDLATHRRRAARIWNALGAIPLATEGRTAAEALLHVINYGAPVQDEVQCRVQGHFASARLLSPESEPRELKIYRRGTTTEVFLPRLQRLAVVECRRG